jgi:flavin-dependent thymidylate synthase
VKVELAGFNVDHDILKGLTKNKKKSLSLTPEIFSAAYARISRSSKNVTELRKEAKEEIEKARKSNRNIIFGMGHHSVAEHAVFNFDIMDVSRLLAEEIERFRLCSYTEKSQRYIKLKGDFIMPAEIKKTPHHKKYREIIQKGKRLYHTLYNKILQFEETRAGENPSKKKKKDHALKANEDARYILSLSQKTQLGETINGRNLELLLRRFASHELEEGREFGKRVYSLVKNIAPSIILFYQKNDFDHLTYPELRRVTAELTLRKPKGSSGNVRIIDSSKKGDDILLASILHTSSTRSYQDIVDSVRTMTYRRKKEIIKNSFKHMELFDSVLREFEHVRITFSLIVSASCFAQLKRHRLASITTQKYDPKLGVTIPQSVIHAGMDKEFSDFIKKTDDLFGKLEKRVPTAAQYILTNAHRKRVLLTVNARELYHISRLREDEHAQWEIRELTEEMMRLAKRKMPLTFLLSGGKDKYPELYKEIFGTYPKITKPVLPS